MSRTKSNSRSQEKYAEAMNYMRKRQVPQSDRELVCQLYRRICRLERELTAIKKQLSEIACNHAGGEVSAPHSQSPSPQPLHRGGSKKRTAYMIYEEDLIRIAAAHQRSIEDSLRSSLRQRALDEL